MKNMKMKAKEMFVSTINTKLKAIAASSTNKAFTFLGLYDKKKPNMFK